MKTYQILDVEDIIELYNIDFKIIQDLKKIKCKNFIFFFIFKFAIVNFYLHFYMLSRKKNGGGNMKTKDLKEIRRKRGLLQVEIATKCNISPGFYCLVEKGKRRPSLKNAKSMSYVLGITLDEFYQALKWT